jgi:hypothetical protein
MNHPSDHIISESNCDFPMKIIDKENKMILPHRGKVENG